MILFSVIGACAFSNTGVHIFLYLLLVRSVLEYDSVVRSPYWNSTIDRLNKIQNKFVCIVLFRSGFQLNIMVSLTNRCHNLSVAFIDILFNGLINSPDLLNKISLVVPPSNFRNLSTLKCNFYSIKYSFVVIDCTLYILNNVNYIDIFHLGRSPSLILF